MKATEQYFPVMLFITLYNMVLIFESVGEILKFDHSNEILILLKRFKNLFSNPFQWCYLFFSILHNEICDYS